SRDRSKRFRSDPRTAMGQSDQTSSVRCGQPDRAFPSAVLAPGCPRNMASRPEPRKDNAASYLQGPGPSARERSHARAPPAQHHPTERDHVQLCNGVPNDGEGFLTHRPIRGYVVGRVDVPLIDLIFWNELVDVDGAGALDLNGFYFLILDKHVLALGDLVAAH